MITLFPGAGLITPFSFARLITLLSGAGLITLFSWCWFDYFVFRFPGLITFFPGFLV